jgi:hypothetical protein
MSVSGVSSTPALANVQLQPTAASRAKSVDGDYKIANSKTAHAKDVDGDYKPISTTNSAAAVSSSSTLATLSSLKTGG